MIKRIFMAVVIMLIGATVFFAQPIDRLKERLDLTNEQADKIALLMGDFHKEAQSKRLDINEERINLKRELLKDNPNEDKIKKILDKIARLKSDLEFAKIKNALKIKEILTPEQFLRWQGMMGYGQGDRHNGGRGRNKNYRGNRYNDGMHDDMRGRMHDRMYDRWDD